MQEVVEIIRKLREVESEILAVELACTGRNRSMAAEAKSMTRQAQVYLDTIVRESRRQEKRDNRQGNNP